jgi:hypothetical protein
MNWNRMSLSRMRPGDAERRGEVPTQSVGTSEKEEKEDV